MTETATTTIKGETIPVSTFDTIKLAELERGESPAVKRLLAAARSPGWFYLDLRNSSAGASVLPEVPHVYQLSDEYFMQPKEIKEKDVRKDQQPSQDRGQVESNGLGVFAHYFANTLVQLQDELL